MKMICAFVIIVLLHVIGCFSFPSDGVEEMEKTEGICYLRVKIACSRDLDLEVMKGAGDSFTDPVSVNADDARETIKCLPVPCSVDGKVPGEVAIVGNGIITKPGYLKDAVAYSEDRCMYEQADDHFKVTCEGDEQTTYEEADVQGYQNQFDQRLFHQCPNQYGYYRVRSDHDNGREDRRWEWYCRRVATTNFAHVYWTGYINGFDEPIFFSCNANYFLCGVDSYHANQQEDRRWRFKCCRSNNHFTRNCALSGYTNWFDYRIDFNVGNSRVITSAYSYHSNQHEDRRWKFGFCEYKYCQGV